MTTEPREDAAASVERGWYRLPAVVNRLSAYFSRFVVPISLVLKHRHTGECRQVLNTGFLLRHRGLHMWVSAGHVVERMGSIARGEDVWEVKAARLHDPSDDHPTDAGNLPIVLDPDALVGIDEDEVDVGVMFLRPLIVNFLNSGSNVSWLDERGWRDLDALAFDGYYLVGIPDQWSTSAVSKVGPREDEVRFDYALPAVPVEMFSDPPRDEDGRYPLGSFPHSLYGRVFPFVDDKLGSLDDIQGMSGGPLFGIRRGDGRLRFHLLGIQSSWLQPSRRFRAVDIRRLAQLIDSAADVIIGANGAD